MLNVNPIYIFYQVIAADEGGGHGRSNESLLAGAMAMALAHVNRQQAAAPPGSKVVSTFRLIDRFYCESSDLQSSLAL